MEFHIAYVKWCIGIFTVKKLRYMNYYSGSVPVPSRLYDLIECGNNSIDESIEIVITELLNDETYKKSLNSYKETELKMDNEKKLDAFNSLFYEFIDLVGLNAIQDLHEDDANIFMNAFKKKILIKT